MRLLPSIQILLLLAGLLSSAVVAFTTLPLPQRGATRPHIDLHSLKATKGNENIEKFQVASRRGTGAVGKQKIRTGKPSAWDSFKNAVYGTVDGVGSLSEKLSAKDGDTGVEGGYSSIEKSVLGQKSNISPGQRLMKEYKARSAATPALSQQSKSTFDSIKESFYGGIDAASQVFSSDEDTSEDSLRPFKPLVQSTLSSSEVQGVLPDLQSNNPIKRKIAEGKIKNWEEKERKRQRALEREEAARKFKESVYQFGDAVVASAGTLASVPETVSKAADQTQVLAKKVKASAEEIPVKVDSAVKTVTTIPDKVKTKSDELKKSVDNTVENTKKAIDDVKAIPTKVETSVKETQKKVKDTQENINEAVTSVKVLFGLEKPVPKPPKLPPPPPPAAGDLAKKLAGDAVKGAVTGTAKVAWWAGKTVAISAWNGVQSAVENATGKQQAKLPPAKPKEATTTKPIGDDVDDEVREALELAQSALEFADQKPSVDKKKDDDKDKERGDNKKQ